MILSFADDRLASVIVVVLLLCIEGCAAIPIAHPQTAFRDRVGGRYAEVRKSPRKRIELKP